MLQPRCDGCGGLLESVPSGAAWTADRSPLRANLPRVSPAFGRVLRVALLALLMVSAARIGSDAGGPALAVAAIGVVGLFTVPLIVGE
jgi:hypothetical protein